MANFQQNFNDECRRLARKEIKLSLEPLTKTISELRHTVSDLRKQLKEMQALAGKAAAAEAKSAAAAPVAEAEEKKFRITPARISKVRVKAGLSCPQFAKLLGVSYISVLNWESGKTKPRHEQLQKIANIRGFGKRELKAALNEKGLVAKAEKKAKKAAKKTVKAEKPAEQTAPAATATVQQ